MAAAWGVWRYAYLTANAAIVLGALCAIVALQLMKLRLD